MKRLDQASCSISGDDGSLTNAGALAITLDADSPGGSYVLNLPFRCSRVSFGELPQDATFTYYDRAGATWAATDRVNGQEVFVAGVQREDLVREATAIKITTALVAGDALRVFVSREVA